MSDTEKSGAAIMHRLREDQFAACPDRHAIMLSRAVLHFLIYAPWILRSTGR